MKVVVANQPRILRESLAMALAAQGQVEVVIGSANAAAILCSVKQHNPDCLILSLEVREANPRICRAVLSQYPETLIFAIGPKTLTVHWFDVIVRSARKECSLQTILDLLRMRLIERAAGDRPTATDRPATSEDLAPPRNIPAITPPKREHVCV
jgi:chemotaxis response regulator CheB